MSTKDCVDLLVAQYGGSPKDWKRQSKKQVVNLIVRTFKNTKTRVLVQVEEDPEGNLRIAQTGGIPTAGGPVDPADGIRLKVPKTKELTGRVLYSAGDEMSEAEGGEAGEELPFYCGPETDEGALYDEPCMVTEGLLQQLFADFPTNSFEWNASENMHIALVPEGTKPCELWKAIEGRLRKAGAIRQKGY